MYPLLVSELLRFRAAALAASLVHTALLIGLAAFTDLFTPSPAKLGIGLFAYATLGSLLGIYQLGTYRRLGSWTYLVHRPLAPARIYLALAGAAGLLLLAVVALPLLGVTLVLGAGQAAVDVRHFLMTPFVLGIALCYYLAGAFLVLSPSHARFLLLLLPGLFLCPQPSPAAAFATLALVLAWLGFLASSAFKPDLSTHLERPLAVTAFALPVQLTLLPALSFAALFVYSFAVAASEEGWRSFAAFSWSDYFAEGTYQRTEYHDSGKALALGLKLSGSDRARALLLELDRESAIEVTPRAAAPARRGQLMHLDRDQVFEDAAHGILFTFSHDRMAFAGREIRSGKSAGWFGPDARSDGDAPASRFESVPAVVAGRWLVTERRLHELDPKRSTVRLRFEAPAGERIEKPVSGRDGALLGVLTDRALHLASPGASVLTDPAVGSSLAIPIAVPLPGDLRNLSRVLLAPRADGVLLSFVFGTRSERDLGEARQVLGEVDRDGRYRVIADIPLGQGPPTWTRHRSFLVSPLLTGLVDVGLSWIAPERLDGVGPADLASHLPPRSLVVVAALVALLSGAMTYFEASRRRLGRGARLAWSAAALATSVPGFLSFLLLTSRAEPMDPPR